MKRSPISALPALLVMLAGLLVGGCQTAPPWQEPGPGEKVHTMLEIPLRRLHRNPEAYIGMVFEGRFKYYRIYHDKQDADPTMRGQVVLGKTHFTARPVDQYLQVVQIQINRAQEAWIRSHDIRRQDAIRARVRFAGVAPGEALAFDLLEILETPKHKRQL